MRFRIIYTNQYQDEKSVIYEGSSLYEAIKFSKIFPKVLKVESLDSSPNPVYDDDDCDYSMDDGN